MSKKLDLMIIGISGIIHELNGLHVDHNADDGTRVITQIRIDYIRASLESAREYCLNLKRSDAGISNE